MGDHQTPGIRGRTIQLKTQVARSVLDCCVDGYDNTRVPVVSTDLEGPLRKFVTTSFLPWYPTFALVTLPSRVPKICRESVKPGLLSIANYPKAFIRFVRAWGVRLSPLSLWLYLEPFCLHVARDTGGYHSTVLDGNRSSSGIILFFENTSFIGADAGCGVGEPIQNGEKREKKKEERERNKERERERRKMRRTPP